MLVRSVNKYTDELEQQLKNLPTPVKYFEADASHYFEGQYDILPNDSEALASRKI